MSQEKLPKIIVSIEDVPAISDLLSFVLEAKEIQFVRCSNGVEGLETVKKLIPALVIIDVMMPLMNGWEVYDAIRADENLKQTPILMLTVTGQQVERREAFRGSTIDFYMNKPFAPLVLRRQVEEILGMEIWKSS